LLEGLRSPRSRVAPTTFFKQMHALIDEVADDKRKKARNGAATRSAARS